MQQRATSSVAPERTATCRRRRRVRGPVTTAMAALVATLLTLPSASAADPPYQRGPPRPPVRPSTTARSPPPGAAWDPAVASRMRRSTTPRTPPRARGEQWRSRRVHGEVPQGGSVVGAVAGLVRLRRDRHRRQQPRRLRRRPRHAAANGALPGQVSSAGRPPLLHASQEQRDAHSDPLTEDLPRRRHPLHPVPLHETRRFQGASIYRSRCPCVPGAAV